MKGSTMIKEGLLVKVTSLLDPEKALGLVVGINPDTIDKYWLVKFADDNHLYTYAEEVLDPICEAPPCLQKSFMVTRHLVAIKPSGYLEHYSPEPFEAMVTITNDYNTRHQCVIDSKFGTHYAYARGLDDALRKVFGYGLYIESIKIYNHSEAIYPIYHMAQDAQIKALALNE